MAENSYYREVILAALFHDIGKFYQRTTIQIDRYDEYLNLFCPIDKGGKYFTHLHAAYTDKFFEDYGNILEKINSDINLRVVRNCASKHHKPDQNEPLDYIVTVADHISSGIDRQGIAEDTTEADIKQKYYRRPLFPIFQEINLSDKKDSSAIRGNLLYDLAPLEPGNIFPKENVVLERERYEELWNKFVSDFEIFKRFRNRYRGFVYSFEYLLKALDSLFERYLWCIPSSTYKEKKADISLYDHSITTAAFTAVLYKYHEEKSTLNNVNDIENIEEKKFLFVSGDLSGIQKYIFDLKTTDKNAKILRARSFELQLISDTVARKILNTFELPPFCNLMNAGGRFLLLLPNTESVRKKLRDFRLKIEEYFLLRYFGEISLNISNGVSASKKELHLNNFKRLYTKIMEDAQNAKVKKFQQILSEYGPVIDEEYNEIKGSENVCSYCEKRAIVEDNACWFCNNLVKLGRDIPKAKFLVFKETGDKKNKTKKLFPDNTELLVLKDALLEKENTRGIIYSVNEYIPGYPLKHIPFYLPVYENDVYENREIIKQKGDVKLFEDIANEANGIKKIAMLKADVDNLGFIFSHGFSDKALSISRVATLSRMLNYFFSTYLNEKIRTEYSNIYTVFSGGDDLCLIGPWDTIIDFAIDIQKEFSNFVCNNPYISISAGIALVSPYIPVRDIARMAENNLEKAKEVETKNSVSVFNTTTGWGKLAEDIKVGTELLKNLKSDARSGLSKSLVYRILYYYKDNEKLKKGHITERHALWRSHFAYDVSRNIKDKEVQIWLKEVMDRYIEEMRIIASYALYKTR